MKTSIIFILTILATVLMSPIALRAQETEVLIQTEEVIIGGTLATPTTQKSNALVIMISGSGPQDRDENLFGFKVFGTIADHLSENGVASFRFDDRGVGESTGDFVNSTIIDLTKDVEEIIAHFQSNGFSEFILLGHSQGGIIAGKVAAQNDAVSGVILMASTGVPLGEIVLAQLRLEYESSEIDQSLIEAELFAHNLLMRSIHTGSDPDIALKTFQNAVFEIKSQNSRKSESKNHKISEEYTKEHKIVYGLPSLASFLYYDPTDDLRKLKVPVLALYGGNDMQVTIEQNKDRMELALIDAGVEYESAVFEKANHLFQKSETGLRDEYDQLDKEFVDGFLERVSQWISTMKSKEHQ